MLEANVKSEALTDTLVSVVVPTYNRAHIILDSLESVYQQSYRPLELIVVDDGSTDETAAVVNRWIKQLESTKQFKVRYVLQRNLGGNSARNRGIQESTGTLVAFLDSDDLWHAQKLEKQVEIFATDTEVGGVYCGLRHVFLESDQIQPTAARAYPYGHLLNQMLVHDVTAPTSTYMVRAEAFEQVGCFDEQLQARQDWDMWIRLAASYKIGVVPEVLVDFREHDGVRTASNPQKEINAYRIIMGKYAALRSHASFSVRQAAKAAFYRRLGRVHFHHRLSKRRAFEYQLKAIACWPFAFDSYAALLGMVMPKHFRKTLHGLWNQLFGSTSFAIRSH